MAGMLGTIPYSADVKLCLETEHGHVRLSQSSADFIIARAPVHLPPCSAEVIVEVDGHCHRRRVWLTNGMSESDVKTAIAELEA